MSGLEDKIKSYLNDPTEKDWVEFKLNFAGFDKLGEYLSALANSACYHNEDRGYLIVGVDDNTHKAMGTAFDPAQKKVGNHPLINWASSYLTPSNVFSVDEVFIHGKRLVVFSIPKAVGEPVAFKGTDYIRVGTCTNPLKKFPDIERFIWNSGLKTDWSAQICEGASIADLDESAIVEARNQFKIKNPRLVPDVDSWDDITFLNKARLTIQGKQTRTSLILLGNPESTHYLSPYNAQITWVLKDGMGMHRDYEHFSPPFLTNVSRVFSKIRILTLRYLPDGSLFPEEIKQYDSWVIREAIHNCIAHQDYELKGRISVVENPDGLVFENSGSFLPGSVETVIRSDSPPQQYRNPFLAHAMVNLNMIDTIGSGILKMYRLQQKRHFPLPEFDLTSEARVKVTIPGKVIDEKFTRLLINRPDLDIWTVIQLDKIQKGKPLFSADIAKLRRQKLVEGRVPNIHISARIAEDSEQKAQYILTKALDDSHYKGLIIEYITKFGKATREDIFQFLKEKLPDILDESQKKNKVKNLLRQMSVRDRSIKSEGIKRGAYWVLC